MAANRRDTDLSPLAAKIATRWIKNNIGFIDNLSHDARLACQIDTIDDANGQTASLTLAALAATVPRPRNPDERYSVSWWIQRIRGDHPNLTKLAGDLIHITCMPAADTPRYGDPTKGPIRPYHDMLFKGGELIITLPDSEAVPSADETFSLGKVVGLAIIDPGNTYTIWLPEQTT